MAIVNLTADSFYAASRVADTGAAAAAAEAAAEAGADLLDLGAESTRPGSQPVDVNEEQRRLLAPLAAIRRACPGLPLSVDTRHAAVAAAALDAGADIVNDVSGLADPAMAPLVAARGCGVVLMHMRGDFATMQRLPPLEDPVSAVRAGLDALQARARAAGIDAAAIALDPGFGFGKNMEQNYPLLARLACFGDLGFPVLVGVSRKSFVGRAVGGAAEFSPEVRLFGSLAAAVLCVMGGAHIVRTHDVAATRAAVRMADAVLSVSPAAPAKESMRK